MNFQSARSLKAELLRGHMFESLLPAKVAASGFKSAVALAAARPQRARSPVALGIRGGKQGFRIALRIQRTTPGVARLVEAITMRARGEVDVRVIGPIAKQASWHRRRNRPLAVGGSIGHGMVTAGTLGAFVVQRSGAADDAYVLSNNHVLANENDAQRGDVIRQPGKLDGGRSPRDRVATLDRFVALKQSRNLVDAAVAAIDPGIEYFYDWIEGLGSLRGVREEPLEDGEIVYKLGRTTGLTKGRVSAIEVDSLAVDYDMGEISFDDQIEIEPAEGGRPFSRGGDSGSLVVDRQRRAVALLFAGNDVDSTFASPIATVLRKLKVDLLS